MGLIEATAKYGIVKYAQKFMKNNYALKNKNSYQL